MGEKADWLKEHNLTEPELLRAAAKSYNTWLHETRPPGDQIFIWKHIQATADNLLALADELEKHAG